MAAEENASTHFLTSVTAASFPHEIYRIQVNSLQIRREDEVLTVLLEQGDNLGADPQSTTSSSTSPDATVNMEKVVKQVKRAVEEKLQALNLGGAALPLLNVSAKGQQISVRFFLSSSCDISHLLGDMVKNLGKRLDGGGGEMIVQASDSTVARELIISSSKQRVSKENDAIPRDNLHEENLNSVGREDTIPLTDSLYVLIFEPLIGDYRATEVEFLKEEQFNSDEIDAILSSLKIAGGVGRSPIQERESQGVDQTLGSADEISVNKEDGWPPGVRWKYGPGTGDGPPRRSSRANRFATQKRKNAMEALESMGVKIYGRAMSNGVVMDNLTNWDCIAGYREQKREIEDTLLLALKRPEVYDTIAQGTRKKFESNRPRAILFEGPPGTGKTSCARVIANQVGMPLLYVPLEVVMSKYFGESEKLLGSIFHAGNELPNGAILFLDEIDALAMARDSEMHEASRRMISILLRQLDGFEQKSKVIVIAATNRKWDLDPAILSRFDTTILFGLPDVETRQQIAAQYAQHLSAGELEVLAKASEGMSGRDIHDICRQAERRWASKLIRGVAGNPPSHSLPPVEEYIDSTLKRRRNVFTPHSCDAYFQDQALESKDKSR